MRFFCMSDNIDTQLGMKLSGIECVVIHTVQEVEQQLSEVRKNSEIGILLITEKLVNLCPDLISDYKLNRKRPLIVEIPDRHGTSDISNSIARYIKEAVGIDI